MLCLRVPIGDRVSYAPVLRRTLGDETGATLGGPPAQKPGSELDRGYCEGRSSSSLPARRRSRNLRRRRCYSIFDRLLPPGLGQTGSRAPRSGRAAAVLIGATRLVPDTSLPSSGQTIRSRSRRSTALPRRTAKLSKGRRPRAPVGTPATPAPVAAPSRPPAGPPPPRARRHRRPCGPASPAATTASPAGRGSGRPGRCRSAGPTR
jgi:hypothetical protein